MCSDAESPLGRAGSEGICSQGGELVELSTWRRAIKCLLLRNDFLGEPRGLEVTISPCNPRYRT